MTRERVRRRCNSGDSRTSAPPNPNEDFSMTHISFGRVTTEQSNIHDQDGDFVGEVFRHPDILNPGKAVFTIHLSSRWASPSAPPTAAAAPLLNCWHHRLSWFVSSCRTRTSRRFR